LLVFRILQPYAFSGPGFFGLLPNPMWLENLQRLQNLVSGDIGFPPNVQWVNRPVWFSWQNMVVWGMGLPMGLLAWVGFLWAGWRMLASWRNGELEWQQHVLLWSWTGFYFIWQSLPNNPTMRYQLPVYPALAIFAAWAVIALWDRNAVEGLAAGPTLKFGRTTAVVLGAVVLIATAAYAFGFSGIYTRPITRIEASRWIYQNMPGPINFQIQTPGGDYKQPLSFPRDYVITAGHPYAASFTAKVSGILDQVYLHEIVALEPGSRLQALSLTLQPISYEGPSQNSTLSIGDGAMGDPQNEELIFSFDEPIQVSEGDAFSLELALEGDAGSFTLKGATIANEGAWDDPLPVRIDGYDAFGGIYQDLNFDMYEVDNPQKLERYINILDQTDYILISSSRQWGSLPRVPQRYPMNTLYYRSLLGCPPERTIEWCYNVAAPGKFSGELGFELVKAFQSNPRIGALDVNDQFAEEAFTVYDHPKVFIFEKSQEYDPQQVRAILGSVDLAQVVSDPSQINTARRSDMMLPDARLVNQRSGGTWSEIFDTRALLNRWPLLSVVTWYLAVLLIGVLTYPLLRLALSGLPDRGYPLARTAGLLISTYLVWLAGSFRIPFDRLTISAVFAVLALAGTYLAYRQREALVREWRARRRYFLFVEGLFLLFFAVDLLIRFGNPDLWHPWKGGERPMDFSYFNAVLKSTSFPPYDPWFAGGYINYYYYGFVLVGVLVKWLGIVPAVAYNLIVPTIFALIALGAFSIGWNLLAREKSLGEDSPGIRLFSLPVWVGLASALGMAVLGNLGTLRMIYQGFQKLAAPGGVIDDAGVFTRWIWAIGGFVKALLGEPLPFGLPDWYWNPSRAIPAFGEVEPITEFPFFTVLYGDPHAHLFALPLTLLALAWAMSVVLGRARSSSDEQGQARSAVQVGLSLLLGGLAIGALRATNTWDFPTYLALGIIAIVYAIWRSGRSNEDGYPKIKALRARLKRLAALLGGAVLLVALAFILFQPYASWYVQGYTQVEFWKGTHTPFWSYLTHWGLFLFVILSWMVWETRDWMASTPLSELRKLDPYRGLIYGAGLVGLVWVVLLLAMGVNIAWFVLPLAAWTGVLLLRPGMPDSKRIVLFLVGTGLVLTLMVEVIVLRGDIGRMNTVFKFYLQTWTLFALSAGAAFGWLLAALPAWTLGWRNAWQIALTGLVASAALYPLMASTAKIEDRMETEAPHTLNGMTFMQYATYDDLNTTLDLSQDYRAIRWLQENVAGSPVIVEGNMVEYHWGTRYTIYTGLPNVIGWNWHQRQQRASGPEFLVPQRVSEVNEFYLSDDLTTTQQFIEEYDVSYVIVGQLERALYPGPGLDKFEALDGTLWQEVYRDGETVIYQVFADQFASTTDHLRTPFARSLFTDH
jgi:YYY domain-containing protein